MMLLNGLDILVEVVFMKRDAKRLIDKIVITLKNIPMIYDFSYSKGVYFTIKLLLNLYYFQILNYGRYCIKSKVKCLVSCTIF